MAHAPLFRRPFKDFETPTGWNTTRRGELYEDIIALRGWAIKRGAKLFRAEGFLNLFIFSYIYLANLFCLYVFICFEYLWQHIKEMVHFFFWNIPHNILNKWCTFLVLNTLTTYQTNGAFSCCRLITRDMSEFLFACSSESVMQDWVAKVCFI